MLGRGRKGNDREVEVTGGFTETPMKHPNEIPPLKFIEAARISQYEVSIQIGDGITLGQETSGPSLRSLLWFDK